MSVGAALELERASFVYPGPPPLTALHPLDLTLQRGEYVSVNGPSGSGKSTLLNLLGLLALPSTGTMRVNGDDVTAMRERQVALLRARHVGIVFQSFHLQPYRSALDNVALAQLYRGTNRTSRHRSALEALDRVGLAGRAHDPPTRLSGGQQQRVAIARALVNRPAIVLCDEPTGNLDSENARRVLALLEELHSSDGSCLVIITHDLGIARRASRRLTVRDGHVDEALVRP